jgi:inhibitor of cysteine peptidase
MPQAAEVEITVSTPRTLLKAVRRPGSGIAIVALVKRALWTVAALAVLAAAATWGSLAWHRHATYGTIAAEDRTTLTVTRGDRFSLAVPDRGASVGDSWSAGATPEGMLTPLENRMIMSNWADRIFGPLTGGGGGTRYFVFRAARAGAVEVTLTNCFQGCDHPSQVAESRSVIWRITVR